MKKLGVDIIFDPKKNVNRKISYNDIEYDADRWCDASRFMPADFDLVYLKFSDDRKIRSGWSIGKIWDGLNINPEVKITYWKRHE